MTKEFAKWADKHDLALSDLSAALDEVDTGTFIKVDKDEKISG
jgi:hypothetical protein